MTACPRCPESGLRHTLVSDTLPGHTCASCGGILVSLVAYRRWRETLGPESEPSHRVHPADDTDEIVTCSKCKGLMTKYRISSEAPNRIDLCASCEDVWLDQGEWDLVEALAGSDHLANIITQPWQRRIRIETEEHLEEARLRERFGEDYDRLSSFREWFYEHPARDEIIAYLLRRLE